MELKIFELRWTGEKEWVCAYTNIHALRVLCNITDIDLTDMNDTDEIIEVPKEKWPEMTIRNSDSDPEDITTFEDYMKKATGPDIIAGTMY